MDLNLIPERKFSWSSVLTLLNPFGTDDISLGISTSYLHVIFFFFLEENSCFNFQSRFSVGAHANDYDIKLSGFMCVCVCFVSGVHGYKDIRNFRESCILHSGRKISLICTNERAGFSADSISYHSTR